MMKNKQKSTEQTTSLQISIIITLVTATVFLMVVFSALSYYREYRAAQNKLRTTLETVSRQISSGIEQPLYTKDFESLRGVVESFMQNKILYGVVVRDRHQAVAVFTRDENWRVVTAGPMVPRPELLYSMTPLTYTGKDIGSVDVYATPRFLGEELQKDFVAKGIYFFSFIVFLVLMLFFLLRQTVITPHQAN